MFYRFSACLPSLSYLTHTGLSLAGGSAVALLSAGAVLAAPEAGDRVGIPEGSFPTASGRGNASYEFGFDLPGFRGLEPGVSLQYDSSRKTKRQGRYQGWTGYGWGLDGFDVIERVSEGRGLAYYDNAKDVFLLNGYELVECVSGTVSPSCSNGGTHATQIESYQRIKFNAGTKGSLPAEC